MSEFGSDLGPVGEWFQDKIILQLERAKLKLITGRHLDALRSVLEAELGQLSNYQMANVHDEAKAVVADIISHPEKHPQFEQIFSDSNGPLVREELLKALETVYDKIK